jgi:GTPase
MQELSKELPTELPTLFISAVTGYNLDKLKDLIWQTLHETNE